jgi:hypothetical protein
MLTGHLLTGSLLLIAGLGLTAAAAHRAAPRLLPGAASTSDRLLRTLLIVALLVVVPVALLGFAGVLGAVPLLVTAGVAFAATRALPPPRRLRWPRSLTGPVAVAAAVLTAAVAWGDLVAGLPSAPVGWDAMTYHLYFPARWLQEGRIFHVPTVFSDNAAAYAPQNGALLFAWQMALLGSDATTDVCQLLALGALALALHRLGRTLGVARLPAALAGLTVFWWAPLRRLATSANVDLLTIAFWTAGVAWLLSPRPFATGRARTGTVAAAGLALGLAAGTKTVGLPLAAFAVLLPLAAAVTRRRLSPLVPLAAGLLAGGGFWYLRNAWLYGNPLFPLELRLGPFALPGAYGTEAVRAGEFHLDSAAAVAAAAWRQLGAGPLLLAAAGAAALAPRAVHDLRRRRRRLHRPSRAALLLALAGGWALFFFAAIPHNDQARFLLPALLAALPGWGLLLNAAARRGRWRAAALALAGVAAAAFDPAPWRGWASTFATLERAGVATVPWLLSATAATGAVAAAVFLARASPSPPRRVAAALLAVAVAVPVLALGARHAEDARPAFLAGADFRGWAPGYLPFARPGMPAVTVAYTGANVPYALMGEGFRHRVVYVNVQGERGDAFHDFFRRDPRRHRYHKPGIYRRHPDRDLWLRHLDAEGVDVLVVFRLHWAEARYLPTTPAGFPIEQAWARALPDRFQPLHLDPAAEIYRVSGSSPTKHFARDGNSNG